MKITSPKKIVVGVLSLVVCLLVLYLPKGAKVSDVETPIIFREGLSLVIVDDRYGFIDQEGRVVIKPQFDYASGFYEGASSVRIGEKWGYIDRHGTLMIEAKFDRALSFSEGLAAVLIG